ncbi:MAG: histidinol-phosphate transaminase [candidate division NC10 bacterium]|nr:histidinol-phosphate transaminase [candidate division NC10 bacterium]
MIDKLASPYLKGLIPYNPGRPVEEVEREPGVRGVVKLASNENPLGPSPLAVKAIQAALLGINRYPDGGGFSLKWALAEQLDLEPEHFILGNGSCEIIDLSARCFLGPQDEGIIADPAFMVYRRATKATGARLVLVPLKEHRHDLAEMARRITNRTKMIFIGNPNNPTGTCVEPREIDAFLDWVPEEVIVLFDEAYYEYMPEELKPDLLGYVRRGRLVLVLRTFSKIHGLASLRVGYGMAPPPLVQLLDRARQPFNVNGLAQVAAVAALGDSDHLAASRLLNEAGKIQLYQQFQDLGLSFVPTAANFILVDVGKDANEVAEALMKKGVMIHPMARYGLRTHLRVTIGTREENDRFIQALLDTLGGS